MKKRIDELSGVWRDTRLIVLTAQIAAVYAAILIPFKVGIPLIPGFSELRPANAIPIVASLLFGPAAAWGSALGNIIGDFFGTLGPGSFFGAIGNFCYGYVPYLLWGQLGPLSSGREPDQKSFSQGVELVLVCLAASLTIALIIGGGVDVLGLVPFQILAPAIFLNNFLMGILLSPPLLHFLYPRVKRWGLRYQDLTLSLPLKEASSGHPLDPQARKTAAVESDPLVEMHDVTFAYARTDRPALNRLSLQIRRGESVAIMGPSGAGKSTLCYTLNGLIPQLLPGRWSGEVIVNGIATTSRPVWRQAETVGIVFQDFETQLISTNAHMELAYPLEHLQQPFSPGDIQRRIDQVLARVGLAGLEHRDPLSLSGGQRQRLVIASILVRRPSLLILDEPTTDLDPAGRRDLLAILENLQRSTITLAIVAQDPEEALSADRLLVLQHGLLVWQGSPQKFFGAPEFAPRYGIRPLALAQCFAGLDLPTLPLTVEEAWKITDALGLSVQPPGDFRLDAPSPSSPPVIELRGVQHEYQHGVAALSNLSLTIRDGEFVGIIGQNGSGKTTLAQLMNGLQKPTKGEVFIEGQNVGSIGTGQIAGIIGYVFQNPDHQIFADTVGREVAFGPKNLGCSPEECQARVTEALEAVGLAYPGIEELDPFSMTKGERQCVAVASVLAARPRILIFDEPTTGLDAEDTARMMQMIWNLNRHGHTIIIITHSLGLIGAYCGRCVLMHQGRVLADGSPRQVFAAQESLKQAGIEPPLLTRFAQRWGHTLLTVDEVKASLRRRSQ